MITQYKEKWNCLCDKMDNLIQKGKNSSINKKIKESKLFNNMKTFFIHKTPKLYHFVSLCNNNNIPVWRFRKNEYKFDYSSRRALVYSFSVLNSFIRKKSFVNTYILLSLLFCRENFNFKNYKFILNNNNFQQHINNLNKPSK